MEKTGNKEKIKESENGKILIKGLVIGSTMTLPGVSGGSMAMVLGIYDRLLKHVSEITKYPKESLTFLLWFAAGAGSGALKKCQCKAYQGERTDMYPYRNLYSPSYCSDPSGDVCP